MTTTEQKDDLSLEDTPKKRKPSLDLKPLWDLAYTRLGQQGEELSQSEFARMTGHSIRAVTRWLKDQTIPWDSADKAAVAMGRLPAEIWGSEWYDVKGDLVAIIAGDLDEDIDTDLETAITDEMLVECQAFWGEWLAS